MLLICLAAQVTATLQALGPVHRSGPDAHGAERLLADGRLGRSRRFWAPDRQAQAYVVAVSILIAGVLQLGVQLPALYRLGFRFQYNWAASRDGHGADRPDAHAHALQPGGHADQHLHRQPDRLGAGRRAGRTAAIPWLGGAVRYPLEQGAAAAIYYGERMYQFPLGIVGMAVAASIFPLLSRHAAHGRRDRLGADLSLGLRLVLCLSVPAGVGLIVLAHPLAQLLFQNGNFTPFDTARAARMIAAYALGVWAYCDSTGDGPRLLCPGRLRHAGADGGRGGRLEPGLEPRIDLDAASRGRAGRVNRHLGRGRGAGALGDLRPLSGPAPRPRTGGHRGADAPGHAPDGIAPRPPCTGFRLPPGWSMKSCGLRSP